MIPICRTNGCQAPAHRKVACAERCILSAEDEPDPAPIKNPTKNPVPVPTNQRIVGKPKEVRRIHLWNGNMSNTCPQWRLHPPGEAPWQRGVCGAFGHDMVTDVKHVTCSSCKRTRAAKNQPPYRKPK